MYSNKKHPLRDFDVMKRDCAGAEYSLARRVGELEITRKLSSNYDDLYVNILSDGVYPMKNVFHDAPMGEM